MFKYERKPFDKLGVLDALAYNKETKVIDLEIIHAIIDWIKKSNYNKTWVWTYGISIK